MKKRPWNNKVRLIKNKEENFILFPYPQRRSQIALINVLKAVYLRAFFIAVNWEPPFVRFYLYIFTMYRAFAFSSKRNLITRNAIFHQLDVINRECSCNKGILVGIKIKETQPGSPRCSNNVVDKSSLTLRIITRLCCTTFDGVSVGSSSLPQYSENKNRS